MFQARSVSPPAGSCALAAAFVAAIGSLSCAPVSEIILVVDTDLEVGTEIDRVEIGVTGGSGRLITIPPVDLGSPKTPALPLTLGLVADSSDLSISITVTGLFQGPTVVAAEEIRTEFVPGMKKVVRVVLSLSCSNATCAENESCRLGKCVPRHTPGDDLPNFTSVPRPVSSDPNLDIAGSGLWANGWRTCASKGAFVYCWGDNEFGQMGNGRTKKISPGRQLMGTPPKGLKSLALGYKHTCACDVTGQVWCWGLNDRGQVGSMGPVVGASATEPPVQLVPVMVPEIDDCQLIAAGGWHSCAIRRDNTLWCWGSNAEGQLGHPVTSTPSPTPLRVPVVGESVGDVAAGEKYTCSRNTNSAVHCWGDNMMGQLGDGTKVGRPTPVRITLSDSVANLAMGRFFGCVLFGSRIVSCWGESTFGMSGPLPGPSLAPTIIEGLNLIKQVRSGHQQACALRDSGIVSCWGGGSTGQLGNGGIANSRVPVDVVGLAGVTEIAVGLAHGCARNTEGIFCWGENALGQLGPRAGPTSDTPVKIIGF